MPLVSARIVNLIQPDAIAALAFAGPDQSVLCASVVQLEGQILGDDIANHTFEWEQTSGTPVTLINPNTLTPSFVNPQTSDIVFTLYVDRNTPFEDSDSVEITRRPQDRMAGFPMGSVSTIVQSGAATPLSRAVSTPNLLYEDAKVTPSSFVNPPAGYSPLYEAEDVDDMRNFLNGRYWLMNDIDMSEYENWDSIGTLQRPFSGELQGNGYEIQNLTITDTPILQRSSDPNIGDVTFLATFENASAGAESFTPEIGPPMQWVNYGGSQPSQVDGEISTTQAIGSKSLYSKDTAGPTAAGWEQVSTSNSNYAFAGDFTIEMNVYVEDDTSGIDLLAKFPFGDYCWSLACGNSGDFRRIAFDIGTSGTTSTSIFSQSGINGGADGLADQDWSHLAITRQGNDWYCFIDGQPTSDSPITNATPIRASNAELTIGQITVGAGGGTMQFYLDNIRITDGFARYTTAFTPPTVLSQTITKPAGLFSAIGNGALINGLGVTDATITGVAPGINSGLIAGTAQGPSSDDGGQVNVENCYVAGEINAPFDPYYNDIIFLYHLDGDLTDSGPNGYDLNAQGSYLSANGAKFGTQGFDLTTSLKTQGGETSVPISVAANTPFTFELWAKFDGTITGVNPIKSLSGTGTVGNDVGHAAMAMQETTGQPFWSLYNGSTFVSATGPSGAMSDGEWHHLAAVRRQVGANWITTFYVDGSSAGGTPLNEGGSAQAISDGSETWKVGSGIEGNTNSGFLGQIDEVRFTNNVARYTEDFTRPEFPFPDGVDTNVGGIIGHTGTNSNSVYENNLSEVAIPQGGGGFAGTFENNGTYTENYVNTDINPVVTAGGDTPGSSEVDGKTATELEETSTYVGWDFVDAWVPPKETLVDGDEFFDNVVLLLDFEGNDGDTTTTDASNDNRTGTFVGGAEIDDAQAKFGNTSLALPNGGDYVSYANDAAWVIQNNAYTIEAHIRMSSLATTDSRVIIGYRTTGAQHGFTFQVNTSNELRFAAWRNGNATPIISIGSTATFAVDTWYHVAAVREVGGDWALYIDGVQDGSGNDGGGGPTDPTDPLFIGRDTTNSARDWQGWIDNVRITRGTARYTGNFTPPTAPYGTQTSVIQVNSDKAELREQDTLTIRESTCLDSMIAWQYSAGITPQPTATDGASGGAYIGKGIPGTGYSTGLPVYVTQGAIVERKVGNDWESYVRIPSKQKFFNLATDDTVRIYWRWRRFGGGMLTQNIETLHPVDFSSRDVTGATTARIGGTGTMNGFPFGSSAPNNASNLSITIQNPRKITMQVIEPMGQGFPFGSDAPTNASNVSILKAEPLNMLFDNAMGEGFPFGSDSPSDASNLSINRSSGASIGGG